MSGFIDSISGKTQYEEFKYVIQDRSSYGFGARMTYSECLENTDVPFKFRAIIEHYILKDQIDPETTLESHLYYMTGDEFAFKTYKEIKARIRLWMKVPVKGLFSREEKMVTKERVVSITELAAMDVETKKAADLKIGELIISKLSLMSFSV